MIAKQSVYLTGDRKKAVAEGDKEARFLLVREGHEIEDAIAEQYEDAIDLIGTAAKKKEDAPKVPAPNLKTPAKAASSDANETVKTPAASAKSATKTPARKSAKK